MLGNLFEIIHYLSSNMFPQLLLSAALGEVFWWNFFVTILGYGNLGGYHFTLIYFRLATI